MADAQGPPFTVPRYGSLGASIIAERDWLRAALERIQQEHLTWAMTCACNSCQACDRLDEVIRAASTPSRGIPQAGGSSVPQSREHT